MKTTVYMYRLRSEGYVTEWRLAMSAEAITKAVDGINRSSREDQRDFVWDAEVAFVDLEPSQARALAGYLLGSQTTGRKAAAARENGKKGGRPRKDAATGHRPSPKGRAEPDLFSE